MHGDTFSQMGKVAFTFAPSKLT